MIAVFFLKETIKSYNLLEDINQNSIDLNFDLGELRNTYYLKFASTDYGNHYKKMLIRLKQMKTDLIYIFVKYENAMDDILKKQFDNSFSWFTVFNIFPFNGPKQNISLYFAQVYCQKTHLDYLTSTFSKPPVYQSFDLLIIYKIFLNIVSKMTSIIDTLYVPDLNLNKKYRRGPLSFRSISIQKETPKKRIQQTQINSFIIPGKNGKLDIFFNVDFLEPETSVKIFLFSKLGHILKASSEIANVELIRFFFNQTQFYRPSVNPLTGFLFFKIDFFTFGKRKSDFKQSNKAEWVLKGIDTKKLVSSIKNLHLCEKILEFKGCDGWYADQKKNRFASVKQIARTIQGKNLYQAFTDKQKKVSSGIQQSRNQQIQQLQDLLLSQKQRQTPLNIQKIIQSVKKVEKTRPYLGTFIKTKGRRSNFDPLFISAPTRNKINEQINIMLKNNIQASTLKLSEQSYENAVLKLEKIPSSVFQKRKQFFSHLTKLHAYDQIDKYFDSQVESPIQISLDSRCESLQKYLQKNGNVISLETKLRILIQIFTFVNVLWEENELVFLLNNIENTFLTKKLCVKMRGLDDFFKSDKQMVWEDFDLVNRKRSESILNLSDLYFKLFYNRHLYYIRPRAFLKLNKQLSERWKLVEMDKISIGNDLPKDVTSKTKELLTSLNYLFSQQVNASGNNIQKMNTKQQINGMMGREQKFQWIKNSQQPTDCSSDDQSQEENLLSTAILSTRYVACWLMKDM